MTSSSPQRKFFSNPKISHPLPDLLKIQKESYAWFLKEGIGELFKEISPVTDPVDRGLEVYFTDYFFDEPKFDEVKAKNRNLTHEASLRVKVRLVNKKIGKSKEQEVYLGDFPLMNDRGTFVINGIERAVVSQLMRSPGVFINATVSRGRRYYSGEIIPNRGAWVELVTDTAGVIWVKIDRKRKVAATSMLRAMGYETDDEILDLFSDLEKDQPISYVRNTLAKDKAHNADEGLIEVYKRIRPGDLAAADNARSLIFAMFFNFERYDLGKMGRYKLNQRFAHSSHHARLYGGELANNEQTRVFRKEDLACVMREVIRLNYNQEPADDIDHLDNRRIRGVGELVQNRLRVGLARTIRIIKDRLSTAKLNDLVPNQLVNPKPIIGVLRDFFMSSQLCQFMDQTNPLAELEHKRRISLMGPGGLSRERAGFEVRDVHRSFYGKICPIATPEGPNIGLVGHLALYSDLDEYGFLRTPYFKVLKDVANDGSAAVGKIASKDIYQDPTQEKDLILKAGQEITASVAQKLTKTNYERIPIKPQLLSKIEFLNSKEEEKYIIASANHGIDQAGNFMRDGYDMRHYGKPGFCAPTELDYTDISFQQIISTGTACIPFLENTDANRALMGTNMQRQAVPCIKPQAPIVGTGMEGVAAANSGHLILNKEDGIIESVDALHVSVKDIKGKVKTYYLDKFVRSNASTCLNHKPIVEVGQRVKAGDVLADGPAMDQGELALGQNLLVGFMSWEGWNYEDAVVLSSRVLQRDAFSSVHIDDYSVDVRDTKLGAEEVTRDIPNVSEEKLNKLDEEGVIIVGAQVKAGDILVGKITPKGETELSAEEKLLKAIFGEKVKDIRDTSLYLEHGEHGKVVDVKIFSREQGDKLSPGVIKTIQVTVACLQKIQPGDKFAGRHGNKGVLSTILPVENMPYLKDGTPLDVVLNPLGVVSRMNLGQILETHLGLAASTLGIKVATPVFDGLKESQIKDLLKQADLPDDGQLVVYDGRTGEPFKNKVTVGYIYMMKLNHLVEHAVHQRSIGPYSLITQQPLGGKAQFGGQRFGEMEVWALEGYGAAHILQEMLTIKSDDVPGRSQAYESIIKGEPINKISLPESFNVLVKELKGLCLDIKLIDKDGKILEEDKNN
ncbi:MAG: DNA-directed RNA polymerase subunit beta [Patescibacteria group bacterium]|nr:DNA-directed RNA polymerase subunit beta [Patescibacteria group bacterium]